MALRESPATTRYQAKFILATDGRDFEAENVVDGETIACAYSAFADQDDRREDFNHFMAEIYNPNKIDCEFRVST